MTTPAFPPMWLGLNPTAVHEALDLAEGSVMHDGSALWRHDGITDAFDLVAALSKLAALLAGTVAKVYTDQGHPLTALDILAAVRAHQEPRRG